VGRAILPAAGFQPAPFPENFDAKDRPFETIGFVKRIEAG
jgi:hypothetical protein